MDNTRSKLLVTELVKKLEEEFNKPTEQTQPMQPFITGSVAYGTPDNSSDIDLVIPPTDKETIALLQSLSDGSGVLRYGDLNLIIAPSEEAFHLWKKCNDHLVAIKPVSRKFAINYIESSFNNAGIARFLQNSGE